MSLVQRTCFFGTLHFGTDGPQVGLLDTCMVARAPGAAGSQFQLSRQATSQQDCMHKPRMEDGAIYECNGRLCTDDLH
jgi:hypothetical protein